MIQEWIDYLCTPAPEWAKQRGLLYESVSLKYRSRRQREAWAHHLQQCHQVTEKFLNLHPKAERIFVLGSGYLMEFPVVSLAGKNVELILVDAVHPRGVQRSVPASAQVRKVNVDLTAPPAEISEALGWKRSKKDLVISCNVMSQLAHSRWTGAEASDQELTKTLVGSHLDLLNGCGSPVLLLSDFKKTLRTAHQEIISEESTLAELPMPRPQTDWIWQLAPRGEFSKDYSVELTMGAWLLPIMQKAAPAAAR